MKQRYSRADWQRLIDEQGVSGLTQRAFCAQAGIAVATFGYWKRKLRADSVGLADGPTAVPGRTGHLWSGPPWNGSTGTTRIGCMDP